MLQSVQHFLLKTFSPAMMSNFRTNLVEATDTTDTTGMTDMTDMTDGQNRTRRVWVGVDSSGVRNPRVQRESCWAPDRTSKNWPSRVSHVSRPSRPRGSPGTPPPGTGRRRRKRGPPRERPRSPGRPGSRGSSRGSGPSARRLSWI